MIATARTRSIIGDHLTDNYVTLYGADHLGDVLGLGKQGMDGHMIVARHGHYRGRLGQKGISLAEWL
jgi:hypothetical protein